MIKITELKQQIIEMKDVAEFLTKSNEGFTTQTWAFATLDLEKSLDTFMQQLYSLDRMTAIRYTAIFARYAFEYVRDNRKEQVAEIGFSFFEADPCMDGEPIEKQLKNVEAWLRNPTPENQEAVEHGIDPSRQLEIWEEDLFPPDDQMWMWIIENTQLLSMAVPEGGSEESDYAEESSPYNWSSKVCLSRSALCSLKTIAQTKRTLKEDLSKLFVEVAKNL